MARPPAGPRDTPIFVVGHPRSGTTLLRLILNAHSRIVVPPEAHVVGTLRRAERRFGPLANVDNRRRAAEHLARKERLVEWGFPRERLLERLLAADPPTPAGLLAALMSLWTERAGKPRWGEKTPGNTRYLRELGAWFPDARVVHLVRDGRDVALSCLTPPFSEHYDKGDVYAVALRWRHALRSCRRARRRVLGERLLELRYEDLVLDPEARVRELCAFLGERFEPAMLDFHATARAHLARGDASFHARTARPVDAERAGRWRREAAPDFVAAFEAVAGRELAALGYPLSGLRAPPRVRLRAAWERWRPQRLDRPWRPRDGSSPDLRKAQRRAAATSP